MKRIAILSASVRTGRLSHRVALYLENYFRQHALADTELLDLKAYDFPLFHERLAMQEHPSDKLIDFTNRFNDADGLIIVSPVYNASYPAALKNVIDLYYKEWKHKPVGIVSVTSGKVPGIATVQQLQVLLLKLGALVAPDLTTVINAGSEFNEQGEPRSAEQASALILPMLNDLLWLTDKN